ncbi:DUF6507 family protein [Georgenia phoenicis]|uniref:DUF6507 family protein n=1 Tax=unclassified Georgenia TaxID=2626815 RepID=UPI0039AFA2F8
MAGWRITPEGVGTVLTSVGTAADLLSGTIDELPPAAEAAAAGTGNSPVIADALIGFFEHYAPTLESIGTRINNAVGGASAATRAYIDGDLEMAGEVQAAAAAAGGTEVWAPAGAGTGSPEGQ